MPGVFISYRREDAAADAGRLYDRLKLCCQSDVYLDVTTTPGSDFRDVIKAKLEACDVVLVIIGPHWLSAKDPDNGMRRLDAEGDFVHLELATALTLGKTVIPLLVRGARMPREHEVPEDIRKLSYCMAVAVRHEHWDADVGTLISDLRRSFGWAQNAREDFSAKLRPAPVITAVALLTAVHILAVSHVEIAPPQVLYIGLAVVFGSLHAFQFTLTMLQRVAIAGAIALGTGLLSSIIVPVIYDQPIFPRSVVEVRHFALLCAGILGGYIAGALPVDAVKRRRIQAP